MRMPLTGMRDGPLKETFREGHWIRPSMSTGLARVFALAQKAAGQGEVTPSPHLLAVL